MQQKKVDIVVIGSGIGGLTVAALLAKSGRQVLLLEQHDRAGGYAHGFKRKKYSFDAGVHLSSGCGLQGFEGGQIIRKVLQAIGQYEKFEFIKVNPFAFVSIGDIEVELPVSIDAMVNQLADLFPSERQGLVDLLTLCLQLAEQVAKCDEVLATTGVDTMYSELDLLFKYRSSTLASVWGDYISDPQLQCIFAAQWPYLGLPPERVSFVYWASMLMGYVSDGAFYCKGGFQNFADTLVTGFKKAGGEIYYKCKVDRINVSDNQVQGIRLASGEIIHAKTVIANADMLQTVYQLVGEEYFPSRYLARLQRMQASCSLFVVYIATDLDLVQAGAHHEAFYYHQFNHEDNYNRALQGEVSWLGISVPTLVDDSIAPKGEHLMVLTVLANFNQADNWQLAKAEYTHKMLDFAETKFPGLKSHILFIEAGSPATMQRYTLNNKGAAYGWAVTPEQVGANRIANQSPIEGLYFSGHWTTPGGGVYGVSYSGVQTAMQVLGLTKQNELWALCAEGSH
ncbi:prolycopene isomerase [Bathymodiolus japonicus methanotrophic gill symbiont]|uniref:phytoene desaturase family protein n=1 Tax=Bathymodiolus japonicus methanotrophic gill symbiont TaxID=113269 RepID=UPI001B753E3F|nr:NAD(P)/FAD-dependent oxidoreductase [Bathymodiolus japonicus methanotrophic gill symbiont]GFO72435.1 prolycopene isomerase [Bathymodiolus japonicus methanotrophic gill symbiont]